MPDKNLGFLLCTQALSSKSEMTRCGFAKKLLETVNPWRQNDGFMEKILAYDTFNLNLFFFFFFFFFFFRNI